MSEIKMHLVKYGMYGRYAKSRWVYHFESEQEYLKSSKRYRKTDKSEDIGDDMSGPDGIGLINDDVRGLLHDVIMHPQEVDPVEDPIVESEAFHKLCRP